MVAIALAMFTDGVDGYLARRYKATSTLGAILDPLTDKFFVFFALMVFLSEGRLLGWQVAAMMSRDFFLCLFGLYLYFSGHWDSYRFQSVRWGKVSTALQLVTLVLLTLSVQFPSYFYCLFILFGVLAFIEFCSLVHTCRK